MTDILSLIVGIPATVEGFVKTCRVIGNLKSLEQDHKESVKQAMFSSELLAYYASLIDTDRLGNIDSDSFRLMTTAFAHAFEAHIIADNVIKEWTKRLGIKGDSEKDIVPRSGRLRIASLADAIAYKLRSSKEKSTRRPRRPLRIINLFTDANYLAFGSMEIEEAVKKMDRWTKILGNVLLLLPIQHLVHSNLQDQSQNIGKRALEVTFVAQAREKAKSIINAKIIDVMQLQYAVSIDPTHNSPIQRLQSGTHEGCILDLRDLGLNFSLYNESRSDTEKICKLFSEDSPEAGGDLAGVGILPCCGYIDLVDYTEQYLVFRPPQETLVPRTLRSLLLDARPLHPLNSRLEFSIRLATSVLIVHSLNLVHKNIRPDSIIVIETVPVGEHDRFPYQLGVPYLVSFDQARTESGPSGLRSYRGAVRFETLYQHPRHLTSSTRIKYEMRDDIYSLGICLLEVALWKSLFKWNVEVGGFIEDTDVVDLSDKRFEEELARNGYSTRQDKSWQRQRALTSLAEQEVVVTMGETFKQVVVDCLMFGSRSLTYKESMEKRDESKDPVVMNQSVKFIQSVLDKLRGLTLV